MQLGLERGQLLLAGGRQVRVELQEVREQLPQLLPLHRLCQGGRHETVKASLFPVTGNKENFFLKIGRGLMRGFAILPGFYYSVNLIQPPVQPFNHLENRFSCYMELYL